MQERCRTCQLYGLVVGGDVVPYGSTTARLPEVYGCIEEYDGDEDGYEVDTSNCSHYVEIPKCTKHPTEYAWSRSGCNACEAEYYELVVKNCKEGGKPNES